MTPPTPRPSAEERWERRYGEHERVAVFRHDFVVDIRAAEQAAREQEKEEILAACMKVYGACGTPFDLLECIRQRHAKREEPEKQKVYYDHRIDKDAENYIRQLARNEARDIAREEIHHIVKVLRAEGSLR